MRGGANNNAILIRSHRNSGSRSSEGVIWLHWHRSGPPGQCDSSECRSSVKGDWLSDGAAAAGPFNASANPHFATHPNNRKVAPKNYFFADWQRMSSRRTLLIELHTGNSALMKLIEKKTVVDVMSQKMSLQLIATWEMISDRIGRTET